MCIRDRLNAEETLSILRLGKAANSIELKLTVPLMGHRATIKGIGLDPVEAQPRQAFFFDTPDLALNRAGVVVRARRIQGCLLYTSDAADERSSVDLGGRRIITKKTTKKHTQ